MTDPLGRWPLSLTIPVQWGDMDSFSHVNNVVYLRWFETARIAYFRATGMLDRMEPEGVGPILARTTIDYRLPLEYPDEVRVQGTVLKLGNTSLTMGMRVRSREKGDAIAAEGEGVIVLLDYRTGAKVPIWDELRARIAKVEAGI